MIPLCIQVNVVSHTGSKCEHKRKTDCRVISFKVTKVLITISILWLRLLSVYRNWWCGSWGVIVNFCSIVFLCSVQQRIDAMCINPALFIISLSLDPDSLLRVELLQHFLSRNYVFLMAMKLQISSFVISLQTWDYSYF